MASVNNQSFSLFPLTQPDAGSARVALFADQACLKVKLAGLGTIDPLLELKKQFLLLPLTKNLRYLVGQINSLGDENRPDEMVILIEKIERQLSLPEHERLIDLLRRLKILYQEEVKEGHYDNYVVTLSLEKRYLSIADVDQIAPVDQNGKIVKRPDRGGSTPVHDREGVFYKCKPSATLYEGAYHLLGKIIFAISPSAPTELMRLHRKIRAGEKDFYLQASLGNDGICLETVVRERPDWIPKFDRKLYGQTFLLHLLGLVQDGKFNNYKARPHYNSEGELIRVTWKGHDEELCFSHPICRHHDTHFVNVRAWSFSMMPLVDEPILREIREESRRVQPAAMTLQWILELWERNNEILEFFRAGHISEKKMKKLQLPLLLLEETVPQLYRKLIEIRAFMMTAPPNATYMDLLKAIHPELGEFYTLINHRHPADPFAAFYEVFHGGGPVYEHLMKDLLNIPDSPLLPLMQRGNFHFTDFETLRNTPPELAAEHLLENLDFESIQPEEQLRILEILQRFPLSQITLRNSSICDSEMHALIRTQPRLTQLTLIRCRHLQDPALQCIAAYKSRLELRIQDCPGFSPSALEELSSVLQITHLQDIASSPLSISKNTLFAELTKALEAEEWNLIKTQVHRAGSNPYAVMKIVEHLITSDLMRQIVKKDQRDVIEYLLRTLHLHLFQQNSKKETFFHLCCEENKPELLEWLCKEQPSDWEMAVDQRGFTPAHTAASCNHVACLRILSDARAPMDTPDRAQNTPLQVALQNGQLDAARFFILMGVNLTNILHGLCRLGWDELLGLVLERGIDPMTQLDKDGRSPLFTTIEYNQEKCFKLLLPHSNDHVDKKKRTALMFCAECNREPFLRELIFRGASTEVTDEDGMTAAQIAALSGAYPCLRVLFGDSPTLPFLGKTRNDKKTFLHLTTLSGKKESVEWVLMYDPPLTSLDDRGMTAAHYAAASGRWDILALFLDKGFPIDFQETPTKETCLVLALLGHHFEVADKLIKRGANKLSPNHKGLTVAHLAAKAEDILLLIHLVLNLRISVEISSRDSRKVTPLHVAALEEKIHAAQTLLDLRADVNATDREGKTPLHIATRVGNEDLVKLLVGRGGDPGMVSTDGNCIHIAADRTRPELIEYFLTLRPELVNSRTPIQGHTPLHRVMYQGQLVVPGEKLTPEQISAKQARQVAVESKLLQFGANIDALDDMGYVPLTLAARWGRADLAAPLLRRGARRNIKYDKEGVKRTPLEHALFMLPKTTDPHLRTGIQGFIDLFHEVPVGPRKVLHPVHRTFQEAKKIVFQQLRSDRNFRPESLLIMREMELQLPELPLIHGEEEREAFWREFTALLKEWKQVSPRDFLSQPLVLDYSQSVDTLVSECLSRDSTEVNDELICLIPALHLPCEILKSLAQFREVLPAKKLLLQLKGHEALLPVDFPPEESKTLIKVFQRSPLPAEWRNKDIAARRQKFTLLLEKDFRNEAFLEQLVLTVFRMHADVFQTFKLSDFRNIFHPSQPTSATPIALLELDHFSTQLTENCLMFMFRAESQTQFIERLEGAISWAYRAKTYGDFHQAFSLFRAISHPSIVRMHKTHRKLKADLLRQHQELEDLFSPASSFNNYTTVIQRSLAPIMPSIFVYFRQFIDRPPFALLYSLIRQFQHFRTYAKRLNIPIPHLFSECQAILLPNLFPEEAFYQREKPQNLFGENFAWERSRRFEPHTL